MESTAPITNSIIVSEAMEKAASRSLAIEDVQMTRPVDGTRATIVACNSCPSTDTRTSAMTGGRDTDSGDRPSSWFVWTSRMS
jgi:hypothetical protein